MNTATVRDVAHDRAALTAPLGRRDAGLLLLAILGAVFAHRDALGAMVRSWDANPMYSYGYTVPFISAFLVWTQRGRLAMVPRRPSLVPGSLGLVAALLLAAAARLGGIQVLDQLAFVGALSAAIVLLLGWRYAAALWMPLAYLLLMVPMWDGLTEHLHEPFQLRSAAMGVWMLRTIGIPAFGEGTMIVLPGLTLEVARACSGVNYLIAVLALGLPLAYLYVPGFWRRAILLVSALAIAALSNGLRVALIGLLAHLEIGSPLHGPLHMLHGLFVAGIGYVVLLAGVHLLTPAREQQAAGDTTSATMSLPSRNTVSLTAAVATVGVLVVAGVAPTVRQTAPVPLATSLQEFPHALGLWESVGGWDAADTLTVWPGADLDLRRRYRRADGAVVDVYIGYFAEQRQGREIVSHQATELHNRAMRVELDSPPDGTFVVNRAMQADRRVVIFWYELDTGPEADRYRVKLQTLWSTLRHGRSQGAIVLLSSARRGSIAPGALEELAPLVRFETAARLAARGRTAS